MNKKFSIITVCRNAEKTIERTIRSVVGQTFQDKEFIIIDGDSTDSTLSIIEKFRDDIDVFISEPDSGIYDAMNKGVSRASGQYVIFINADDYFYDENVLFRVAAVSGMEEDFLFGEQFNAENGRLTLAENIESLDVGHLFFGQFAHQSIFAKRSLFDRFGLFDLNFKICADWDWILRCIVNGSKTKNLQFPIAVFSIGGASSSAGKDGRISRERKLLLEKNLGNLPFENCICRIEKIFRNLLIKLKLHSFLLSIVYKSLAKKYPTRRV